MKEKVQKFSYVQLHDALTAPGFVASQSLSLKGHKKWDSLVKTENGVDATSGNRKFFVPFANISFAEYDEDKQ